MIMRTLHPSQDFPTVPITDTEGLSLLNAMWCDGVTMFVRSFTAYEGETVTVFWTVDQWGTVATVFEAAWKINFKAPLTPEQLAVSAFAAMMESTTLAPYEADTEYALDE